MKRIFIFYLFLTIAISSYGQYVVTPKGLAKTEQNGKDYYLIELPDTPKSDLYSKTKLFINETWVSSKDVITGDVENEMISVNGMEKIFGNYEVCYKLTFQFKDGKARFDMPEIISMKGFSDDGRVLNLIFQQTQYSKGIPIFNKKGELRGLGFPLMKSDIETLFNSVYNNYIEFIKKDVIRVEDDW